MSENNEEVVDEEVSEEVAEIVDTEQPTGFDKYKQAYYTQKLKEAGVKDDEVESALKFVSNNLENDGSNEESVMFDLRVNMRLDQRRKYVDPSMAMNGPHNRHKMRKDKEQIGYETGQKAFERLRKNGFRGYKGRQR